MRHCGTICVIVVLALLAGTAVGQEAPAKSSEEALKPLGMGAAFNPGDQTCGRVAKTGIFASPPWQNAIGKVIGRYELTLPQARTIAFDSSIGIRDGAPQDNADGVEFSVRVEGQVLKRQRYKGPAGWAHIKADLSAYAGKKIALDLVVDPLENTDGDWAIWGDPRILADGQLVADLVALIKTAKGFIVLASDPEAELGGPLRLTPPIADVEGLRTCELDLSGKWRASITRVDDPAAIKELPKDWKELAVPGSPALLGKDKAAPGAWACRFTVPEQWAGRTLRLRCDASFGKFTALINGRKVGEADTLFLPWEFDITSAAKPGENLLVLTYEPSIFDARSTLGSIADRVRVLALPKVSLSRLNVDTTYDEKQQRWNLSVRVAITNDSDQPSGPCSVRFTLTEPNRRRIDLPAENYSITVDNIAPQKRREQVLAIPLGGALTWEAEHPRRHTLLATLEANKALLMRAQRRFGFRQILVDAGRLKLNQQPITLRGLVYHAAGAPWDNAPPAERLAKDVDDLLAANANFLRCAELSPALADVADDRGMYLPGEVWAGQTSLQTPTGRVAYLGAVRTMVETYRNNPSILLYGVGGANAPVALLREAVALIRALDPTRPIYALGHAGLPFCDLDAAAYPHGSACFEGATPDGRYPLWKRSSTRPMLFTRWCAASDTPASVEDPGECDRWGLDALWHAELLFSQRSIAGGCISAATPPPVGNAKDAPAGAALLDGKRRVRPEWWHVKKVYSPARLIEPEKAVAAGGILNLRVANRYDFTDLNELEWTTLQGGASSRLAPTVPPRSEGVLTIPFDPARGDVTISVRSPKGFLIDIERFKVTLLGKATEPPPPVQVTTTPSDAALELAYGKIKWAFDKKSGTLKSGSFGDLQVVQGGPQLIGFELLKCTPLLANAKTETEYQAQLLSDIECRADKIDWRGTLSYTVRSDGQLLVQAELAPQADTQIGQAGLKFILKPAFRELAWQRQGIWTIYPPNHIGRLSGRASPDGVGSDVMRFVSLVPSSSAVDSAPWTLERGGQWNLTRDYRSTKCNITHASLSDGRGSGFRLRSEKASEHLRVWTDARTRDKQDVHVLVLSEYPGRSEEQLIKSLGPGLRPIKAGEKLTLRAQVELYGK